MHFKSIRVRLIVHISILTFILVLLLQAANLIILRKSFTKLISSAMETRLEDVHVQIRSRINENFSALETISNMPFVKDDTRPLEERAASLCSLIMADESNGYQAWAITDETGKAVLSSGIEIDLSSNPCYKEAMEGREVVSDPFVSKATGNLMVVYAMPYYNDKGKVAGVVTLGTDALHLSRSLKMLGLNENDRVFVIDREGTTVASTDLEAVRQGLNVFNGAKADSSLKGLAEAGKKMVRGMAGSCEPVHDGTRELIRYMPVEGTTWSVAVVQSKHEAYQALHKIAANGVAAFAVVTILSAAAGTFLAGSISRPIIRLVDGANRLAKGNVDVPVDVRGQDETAVLAEAFYGMIRNVRKQTDAINLMAQGDFTVSLPIRSDKDIINQAINQMVDNTNQVMSELRGVAEQVAGGAFQVSDGAHQVAFGSIQQSAAMERLSSVIGEIKDQAHSNMHLAASAIDGVNRAGELMKESIAAMQNTVEAMMDIESSSKQIAQVMKVIDKIAFQTNILALNAAVEAAHAGELGKGFAVVAGEVSNLAVKSAEAARETAQLIQKSLQTVSKGVEVAKKAGEEIRKAGAATADNALIIREIGEASRRQSLEIAEINRNIMQITEVVHANSAAAQESAAFADVLNAQSAMLDHIVDRFKLLDSQEEDDKVKWTISVFQS